MRRLSTALSAALFLAALPSISQGAVVRRVGHTATLLSTSDLLIAGGVNEAGTTLASVDIFAASRGNVVIPTGPLTTVRSSHTATLLTNGCVLAAGGNAAATDAAAPARTATADIYNPATGLWTATSGSMGTARYNHTATLLNSGVVLLCGGQDNAGNALNSCEFYTPTSCTAGAFTAAPNFLSARYNHTAVLLKDGRVWFAGGINPLLTGTGGFQPTTERYDPGSNAFQSASPLIEARSHHTATLMGDGKALVVGGFNRRDVLANKGITESSEIYDPISNSVTPAATMSTRRQSHATVLSANGEVTVYGGLGNITTTFVTAAQIFPSGNFLLSGSEMNMNQAGGVVPPTATVVSGPLSIALDFLLNKPVFGQISDGEMWLSSPAIRAQWGMINFTPASETVPGLGARIDLAGYEVGCRPDGTCGNIAAGVAPIAQLTGQAIFYPKIDVILGPGSVNSGRLNFSANINTANATATLLASSTFAMDVSIAMGVAFAGGTLIGSINLTDATLVQASSFSVTLTGGVGVIPLNPPTIVNANGDALFTTTFTALAGTIGFDGDAPQIYYATGTVIPVAPEEMTVGATGDMTYTSTLVDVSGEIFAVDVATVVIRKMVFADAETYNPRANSWTLAVPPGGTIADQRYGHSATLLPNNDRVFYGGRACTGATCATQIANASIGFQLLYLEKNFAATTGSAAQKRAFHTSTLLPDGTILVAGGTNGPSILSHAEIFTPETGLFTPVDGVMRFVRDLHTATLLPNGRVLVAGGFTTNAASTGSTNTAEIYYPDTKRFIETSPMISSRSNHTAIMLPDGKVFVAGGFGVNDVITATAEIYISTEMRWIAAAPMTGCERAIHATVQLKDGRILLIGGINADGPLTTSAVYTPATNAWSCAAIAAMPTALRSHSATLLFDGRVLVAGGNDGLGEANRSFIYDPAANTWTSTDPQPLLQPRFNHTATLLPNGNVTISGGSQRFGSIPTNLETYHVNASSWVAGSAGADGITFGIGPRAFHTMTLGLNNKLYAIGGSNGAVGGVGVLLYNSAETGYFSATPDNFSKDAPPSFRQSTITATTPATPFLPTGSLTVTGSRFRGGTEAAGGGAASANSSFSFPHIVLQQVEGSGGAASQGNGGFAVDLTTQIFLNAANQATLDTNLTVALPLTNAAMPYGWYTLRTGANGVFSDAKLVQVGPLKPTAAATGVTGVAAGISSMTWTWNNIAGVDGYNIYNATTGIFISSIPVNLLARSTFNQTGLEASAPASIIIAGYTLSGDGPLTASPTSYTLSTTPINVTIASVTFSDLLLYWGLNGNAEPGTVYEVTQSSDNFVTGVGISTPMPRLFELTTNFTIINNLEANTTYFFRVQAFNPVGLGSPYSISVSTRTRTPVTQPGVTARTSISIDWSWTDSGGVTNYRVYSATSGVLLGTPVSNFFTQVNLGTNTLASIRVSAITNAGEGPLSPSASAYTSAATPGVSNPTISQLTTGSFLLNWSSNGNSLATVYRATFTQLAADGSTVSSVTATAPAFAFSLGNGPGLVPSTLYSYELFAFNGDDIASDIAVFGSTWTLPTAPATLTTLNTTPTTISVSWNANNNSSSATYQVTYSTDNFLLNISTHIAFADNFGGTSATIPGLITGATYSVRVIASNPFGQLSQFSNIITTLTFNGGAPIGSLQGPFFNASDSSLFGSLGNGRDILLRAPAGTFPSDVTIAISSFLPAGTLCAGATNIAFSIVADPALQPTGSLYLTFSFQTTELGTIPASRALLLRYDPGSGTCVPLETTVANGQMTARINHFSLFQVGTVLAATSAETARIFPNPYYTGRDGFVTLDSVPAGARVRIFTMRGEQILDVKANSTGLLTWSGTNGSGRAVASGVYIVMVESGGSKKILKLAVIR